MQRGRGHRGGPAPGGRHLRGGHRPDEWGSEHAVPRPSGEGEAVEIGVCQWFLLMFLAVGPHQWVAPQDQIWSSCPRLGTSRRSPQRTSRLIFLVFLFILILDIFFLIWFVRLFRTLLFISINLVFGISIYFYLNKIKFLIIKIKYKFK